MKLKFLNKLADIVVSIDEGKNITDENIVTTTDCGTVTNTVGGITNTYAVYNATGVAAQMLVDIEINRSGVL